ncbi:MAG: LysM peptidoglycan-binding domain-containing protein [Puniceicoccales bacterium]|jgi:LysM repeat protein|nr:LysM peptidoglycan-binding domain-containing protein [Puniceicoccales bacterium]
MSPLSRHTAARRAAVLHALPTRLALAFALVFAVAVALALGGCGRSTRPDVRRAPPPETEDPKFAKARADAAQQGNSVATEAARNGFLALIRERAGEAPESHFEVAKIYLNVKKDPLPAIYHFKEYARLAPGSQRAKVADSYIRSAENLFMRRRLPGAKPGFAGDNDALLELVTSLKNENDALKREKSQLLQKVAAQERELVRLQSALSTSTHPPTPSVLLPEIAVSPAAPPPPENAGLKKIPATYTVRKGDSLTSISKKIYNTPARWEDIYNANRDKLRHPRTTLRIGWVLKMPST